MIPWWSSLVGVVIGGVISALTTYLLDRRRWRRSRQDKKDEVRRQAIESAFAWLDPMYSALMNAEVRAYKLLNPGGDDEEFRDTYPDLIHTLAKLDLPAHHRLLLPPGTYASGKSINREFDEFKYGALDLWEKVHYPQHSPAMNEIDAREQCSNRIAGIRKQVDTLRESLERAYQQTYD